MNPLGCLNDKKNIGVSSCKKIPQQFVGMITTPLGFSLTREQATSAEAWQNALLAAKGSRIYLWPSAVNIENVSEEAVREETSLSTMKVRDGKYQFRFMFQENLEVHKAMYSHNGSGGRTFLIDNRGIILGTSLANGNFAGATLNLLDVEKLMNNDGTVVTKTPVFISLRNNREWDVNGAMVQGDFLGELIALTSATLEVIGTPTPTEIVVSVKSSLDNVPVLGLESDDFVLLDSIGTAQNISAAVDADDEGIYTLSGTALETGTLTLKPASSISVKGFEAKESIQITIA